MTKTDNTYDFFQWAELTGFLNGVRRSATEAGIPSNAVNIIGSVEFSGIILDDSESTKQLHEKFGIIVGNTRQYWELLKSEFPDVLDGATEALTVLRHEINEMPLRDIFIDTETLGALMNKISDNIEALSEERIDEISRRANEIGIFDEDEEDEIS